MMRYERRGEQKRNKVLLNAGPSKVFRMTFVYIGSELIV